MKNVWMIRVGHIQRDKVFYLPNTFKTRKEAREWKNDVQSSLSRFSVSINYYYVVKMEEK
jgi:hypothetical protein